MPANITFYVGETQANVIPAEAGIHVTAKFG
jgi:hypothetical protein